MKSEAEVVRPSPFPRLELTEVLGPVVAVEAVVKVVVVDGCGGRYDVVVLGCGAAVVVGDGDDSRGAAGIP